MMDMGIRKAEARRPIFIKTFRFFFNSFAELFAWG